MIINRLKVNIDYTFSSIAQSSVSYAGDYLRRDTRKPDAKLTLRYVRKQTYNNILSIFIIIRANTIIFKNN